MNRIVVIKDGDTSYLVDTYKSYNVVYQFNDVNRTTPIGQMDRGKTSFIIPIGYTSRKMKKDLLKLHNEAKLSKIEFDNIKSLHNTLDMKSSVIDLTEASAILKHQKQLSRKTQYGSGKKKSKKEEEEEDLSEEEEEETIDENLFVELLEMDEDTVEQMSTSQYQTLKQQMITEIEKNKRLIEKSLESARELLEGEDITSDLNLITDVEYLSGKYDKMIDNKIQHMIWLKDLILQQVELLTVEIPAVSQEPEETEEPQPPIITKVIPKLVISPKKEVVTHPKKEEVVIPPKKEEVVIPPKKEEVIIPPKKEVVVVKINQPVEPTIDPDDLGLLFIDPERQMTAEEEEDSFAEPDVPPIEIGRAVGIKRDIIQEKIALKEYQKQYPREMLIPEIITTLQQMGRPETIVNMLAEQYVNLSERNLQKQSQDPFSLTSPLVYTYLHGMAHNKYWLIPIVADTKKVYNKSLVNDVDHFDQELEDDLLLEQAILNKNKKFPDLSSGAQYKKVPPPMDNILLKHPTFPRGADKTSESVFQQFIASQYVYHVGDLPGKRITIASPNEDRQDYTIQVVRAEPIKSGKFVIRNADGPVYKTHNIYAARGAGKLSKPIIGLKREAVIPGELIDMIGFMRLPMNPSEWTATDQLPSKTIIYVPGMLNWDIDVIPKKHIIRYDQLSDLVDKNFNDPVAVIFPPNSEDDTLFKIFDSFVPNSDTIMRVYPHFFNHIHNLDDADKILKLFDLTVKDVNYDQLQPIISRLSKSKSEQFALREEQLTTFMSAFNEANLDIIDLQQDLSQIPIDVQVLNDPIIVANYGLYPDFNTIKDTQINRFAWITKQLDGGRLYYLQILHQYLNTVKDIPSKLPEDIVKISVHDVEEKIEQMKIDHANLLDIAKKLDARPMYEKTPVLIYSQGVETLEKTPLEKNLLNVFVLDSENNIYVPLIIYSEMVKLKRYRSEEKKLVPINNQERLTVIREYIKRCEIKNKLLAHLSKNVNMRLNVSTQIKVADLTLQEPTLDSFLNQIPNIDKATANRLGLDLVQKRGQLSSNREFYVYKETGQYMCCIHKVAELYGKSLDEYKIGDNVCKYCRMVLDEYTFDDQEFEGDERVVKESLFPDAPIVTAPVKAEDYEKNPDKQYAYKVITYLSRQMLINISEEEKREAINRYETFSRFTELDTYAYLDVKDAFLNKYVSQKIKEDITKGAKKPAQQISYDSLAKVSITMTAILEQYILVILAIVVTLEINNPHYYMKQPLETRTMKQLIGIPDIFYHITDASQKGSVDFLKKCQTTKVPYVPIGDQVGIKPTDYAKQILSRYYQIIIDQPQIKAEYSAALKSKPLPDIIAAPITSIPRVQLVDIDKIDISKDLTVDQIRLKLKETDQLRNKAVNQLANDIFALIRGTESVKIKEAQSIREEIVSSVNAEVPECFRSQVALIDQYEKIDGTTWLIGLDLYVDYLMKNTIPTEAIKYQQTTYFTHIERLLDLEKRLGPLLHHELIEDDKRLILKIYQKSAILDDQLNQSYRTHVTVPSHPIKKTISKMEDYTFKLHKETHHKTESFPIFSERMPLKASGIKQETLIEIITQLVTELNNNNRTFVPQLADKLGIHRNIQTLVHSISNLGKMVDISQQNLDEILLIKNRYNHHWSDEITVSMKLKDDHQLTTTQNESLRYYLYLLHRLISTIKIDATSSYVSTIMHELTKTKLTIPKIVKIFENYDFAITDESIDHLVGLTRDTTTSGNELIDFFMRDVPVKHDQLELDQVRIILHYHLINELLTHLRKLNGPERRTYCLFVEIFLNMVVAHWQINDTTSHEVDVLIQLRARDKADRRKPPEDKEERALWNQFKWNNIKSEPDEYDAPKRVEKEKPQVSEEEGVIQSNADAYEGEADEDAVDPQYQGESFGDDAGY